MYVTDVSTFIVNPGAIKNWLFVKVETDDGITGWGEAFTQPDRDRSVEEQVRHIRRYLIGRSPFNIKHFTQVMYDDLASKAGDMQYYSAISGIEQALWDIVGKSLDTPVYNLLGGACRERIRVYANGWVSWGQPPEVYAENAVETVKSGFTALKFDPFPDPWRTYVSRKDEDAAVENVKAVREAVGPDIDLLIEVHRRLAPMHAVRVARMIEKYDPFWYEEPVSAENIDALTEVKRSINIPVVTGEVLCTKSSFREVFEKRAADIINADVCCCGGILELKEIAAVAEPYHIIVSPHNFGSNATGLAATLQVAACIPNFLITEYFINFKPRSDEISVNPFVVDDGYIEIPKGPGLGLDLDEEAMAKYPYREFPQRNIRQYHQEGP